MDLKTIINSIGIILTMIGVWMVYKNSPLNYDGIQDPGPGAEFERIKRIVDKQNTYLKYGVYILIIGSGFQLISNFIDS